MTRQRVVALIGAILVVGVIISAIWLKFDGSSFLRVYWGVYALMVGFRVPWTDNYYVPDSTAGHIHKPYAVLTLPWKEHPNGSIRMAANNLGFRKDSDTVTNKPGQTYRILVTGDSHVDGFVNNPESFPNRLEALLKSSYQRPQFDVLNGGAAYYGPHNYAGFLRKFLYLKPDMFLVVLYTGNDFLDGVRTAELRRQVQIPQRPEGYFRALEEATSANPGAVWQALNQAYFFKTYPTLETTAVDIAYEQMLYIARTCASEGIEFIVVTLPTKCDMLAATGATTCKNASEKLSRASSDVEINRRMGHRLLIKLNAAGIRTLDPIQEMQRSPDGLFWEADYHLNNTGHDLLAGVVFGYLKALLARMPQFEKRTPPK